jgi:hypothetical protein
MQNFAVGEFSVWQDEQRRVNGDPHSPQNFARFGFSAPHFEQRIAPFPLEPYGASGTCSTSAKIMFNSESSRSCPTNATGDLWPSWALEDVIGPPPVEDELKCSV